MQVTSPTRTKTVAPSANLRSALEAIEKAAAAARAKTEKFKLAAAFHTASSLSIKSVAQPTAALLTSAQQTLGLVASLQSTMEPLTGAHPTAANTEAEPVKAVSTAELLDIRRMLLVAGKIGGDRESPDTEDARWRTKSQLTTNNRLTLNYLASQTINYNVDLHPFLIWRRSQGCIKRNTQQAV